MASKIGDFDDFFTLLYMEEMNTYYCEYKECGKSYELNEENSDNESNEHYCSKKCGEFDMIKDHKCENPDCKNTYKLQNRVKGNYKNRKYCSTTCLDKEPEVEKREQKLEEQWYRIPHHIKSRLQIDNLIDIYRWRELLEYRILLDIDNSDPTNNLALNLILSFDSEC